ncbi:MAG: hypothetical protein GY903_00955 [Fuerstiella sp.]|nr:hypothetical protein [Fuerstiella sp.]MCP4853046.1 hypothetical protein [Fuerstiella sp.]
MRSILTILILLTLTLPADGRLFFRRRVYYRPASATWSTGIRADDQAACQREADHMARYHIRGHVFGLIGRFEGCGWGRGTPGTCVPYYRMTLTGDAMATASNGTVYRVRSWR